MGRGGGGGGGRSGGGGGSRSGGGHSSSHRGSSSSSSRGISHSSYSSSRSSGFSRVGSSPVRTPIYHAPPPPPPPRRYNSYGPAGGTYYTNAPVRRRQNNTGSMVMVIFIMVIVFLMMIAMFSVVSGGFGGVTKSTHQREKLPATASTTINSWFEDDWNWLGTGSKTREGLRYFQKETGIQVYVAVTNSMQGYSSMSALANGIYDDVFGNDEGHAVFVWYERDDGSGNGDGRYETYLCVGTAAGAVLDDEAVEIVLDYFDQCYADSSLTEDELVGRTFTKAADRMMTVTKSPLGTIIILVLVCVIGVIVFKILKAKFKRDKERAEEQQRILETPIEHISAPDKDLEDKYGGS